MKPSSSDLLEIPQMWPLTQINSRLDSVISCNFSVDFYWRREVSLKFCAEPLIEIRPLVLLLSGGTTIHSLSLCLTWMPHRLLSSMPESVVGRSGDIAKWWKLFCQVFLWNALKIWKAQWIYFSTLKLSGNTLKWTSASFLFIYLFFYVDFP